MPGFRHFILLTACLVIGTRVLASEADYLTNEGPMPDSVLELQGSFGMAGEALPSRVARLADALWNRASLTLNPRSYYLDKQRNDAPDSLAWTLGGNLAYQSGLLRDRLSLGAVVYTSQKLHGPADKGGTGLLRPVQEAFTVLGEAHVNARLTEQVEAQLYRQTFNLPYVNRNDSRMAPNTFPAMAKRADQRTTS